MIKITKEGQLVEAATRGELIREINRLQLIIQETIPTLRRFSRAEADVLKNALNRPTETESIDDDEFFSEDRGDL